MLSLFWLQRAPVVFRARDVVMFRLFDLYFLGASLCSCWIGCCHGISIHFGTGWNTGWNELGRTATIAFTWCMLWSDTFAFCGVVYGSFE
jgi:hypothetical protein